MSGSLGAWPMSPAAKPANPAPSLTRSSRFAAGISFALGRAWRSTNWAKKNSIPRSATSLRICSRRSFSGTVDGLLLGYGVHGSTTPRRRRSQVETGHSLRPGVSIARTPVGAATSLTAISISSQSSLPEVEVGELADPPKPLAKRVRVHEQRLGRRADVAAPAEELLERRQELRLPLLVVGGEPTDGVDRRVAEPRTVVRDSEQVLVRAELVVDDDARLPAEHGGAGERVACLLEAVDVRRRARSTRSTARSHAVDRAPPGASHGAVGNRLGAATGDGHERANRVVAAMDERSRAAAAASAASSALVGRLGHEHDVRLRRGRSRDGRRDPRARLRTAPARGGRRSPR